MTRGNRFFNGKCFVLASRVGSKEAAIKEVKRMRESGKLARMVKVYTFDYMIYEF